MSSTGAKRDESGGYVRGFLAHLTVEKGYSEATVRSYGTDLDQFGEFLKRVKRNLESPGRINRDHVRGFLAELHRRNLSKTSMGRKLSSLRAYFKYLRRHKVIAKDPMAGIRNPKQDKRHPQVLNVDQAVSMMEAAVEPDPEGLRDIALAEVLYGSGLRNQRGAGGWTSTTWTRTSSG